MITDNLETPTQEQDQVIIVSTAMADLESQANAGHDDGWELSERDGMFYAVRRRDLTDSEINFGLARTVFGKSAAQRKQRLEAQALRETLYQALQEERRTLNEALGL